LWFSARRTLLAQEYPGFSRTPIVERSSNGREKLATCRNQSLKNKHKKVVFYTSLKNWMTTREMNEADMVEPYVGSTKEQVERYPGSVR